MNATVLCSVLISLAVVSGAAIEKPVPVAAGAPVPSPPVYTNPEVQSTVEKTSEVTTSQGEPGETVVEKSSSTYTEPAVTAVQTTAAKPVVEGNSVVEEEKTVNGKTVTTVEESTDGKKPVTDVFCEDTPAEVPKSAVVATSNSGSNPVTQSSSGNSEALATATSGKPVATATATASSPVQPAEDDDDCSCEYSAENNAYYPSYPSFPRYPPVNPFLYPQYSRFLKSQGKQPIPNYRRTLPQRSGYLPGYPHPSQRYPPPPSYYPSSFPEYNQYVSYYSPLARNA